MEANQEQLAYAIWLDRELERSVKQLAKRAAHNDVRNAHEYRVRATQDAGGANQASTVQQTGGHAGSRKKREVLK